MAPLKLRRYPDKELRIIKFPRLKSRGPIEAGGRWYVDKAHRHGKVGWDVGRKIEMIPHYRRPHLMLAWTDPGRVVPKIVPRWGSIVHRNVVETVPMGFDA